MPAVVWHCGIFQWYCSLFRTGTFLTFSDGVLAWVGWAGLTSAVFGGSPPSIYKLNCQACARALPLFWFGTVQPAIPSTYAVRCRGIPLPYTHTVRFPALPAFYYLLAFPFPRTTRSLSLSVPPFLPSMVDIFDGGLFAFCCCACTCTLRFLRVCVFQAPPLPILLPTIPSSSTYCPCGSVLTWACFIVVGLLLFHHPHTFYTHVHTHTFCTFTCFYFFPHCFTF